MYNKKCKIVNQMSSLVPRQVFCRGGRLESIPPHTHMQCAVGPSGHWVRCLEPDQIAIALMIL